MSKHTPGPWQWDGPVFDYNPEEDAPWLVDMSGAIILCGEIQCQGEENARLIAAAPELLEALKRCKFDSLNMSLEDLEFCRAAYLKATEAQP